jgi:deoxycytidylate deaminase
VKLNNNIVELAIMQARKSPMQYRHGAVLWKDNKILQTGYNFPVHMPVEDIKQFSIHAERDCLKGLRSDQIYGSSLLSVRITNKTENLTSSKPCRGCMALLRRKKVKRVFWFDSDGDLHRLYLGN